MNAYALENLLGEWRQLTEAEGRAIAGDDWTEVQRQQKRKEGLQAQLVCAREAWPRSGLNQADFEQRFRPLVAQLIALETANAQRVVTRRENAKREFAECDRTVENLRGLNRAYGTSDGGHWTSYS